MRFYKKNLTDLMPTIMMVIGTVLMLLGAFLPEKFDMATQEVIKTALNEVLLGIGTLINVFTGMFGTFKPPAE